jgi:hypothetical protein
MNVKGMGRSAALAIPLTTIPLTLVFPGMALS